MYIQHREWRKTGSLAGSRVQRLVPAGAGPPADVSQGWRTGPLSSRHLHCCHHLTTSWTPLTLSSGHTVIMTCSHFQAQSYYILYWCTTVILLNTPGPHDSRLFLDNQPGYHSTHSTSTTIFFITDNWKQNENACDISNFEYCWNVL